MAKVLMRCPLRGTAFDTGLDLPEDQGLEGLGLTMALCSGCGQHHYLRLPYFEHKTPPDDFPPADGLDTAPAFAMEVGMIVATTAFLESYIPQIFSKFTGTPTSMTVRDFGAMRSTKIKIDELRKLAGTLADATLKTDLDKLIELFERCMVIRNYYAHAKYHYSGGEYISVLPYFGDSRKRLEGESVSLKRLTTDAEWLKRIKYEIREYIRSGHWDPPQS